MSATSRGDAMSRGNSEHHKSSPSVSSNGQKKGPPSRRAARVVTELRRAQNRQAQKAYRLSNPRHFYMLWGVPDWWLCFVGRMLSSGSSMSLAKLMYLQAKSRNFVYKNLKRLSMLLSRTLPTPQEHRKMAPLTIWVNCIPRRIFRFRGRIRPMSTML